MNSDTGILSNTFRLCTRLFSYVYIDGEVNGGHEDKGDEENEKHENSHMVIEGSNDGTQVTKKAGDNPRQTATEAAAATTDNIGMYHWGIPMHDFQ